MTATAQRMDGGTGVLAAESTAGHLLSATGLVKRFGGLIAVDGVDLAVPANDIVGIIGPNGAGKTTLLNMLSGALAVDEGTIRLDGVDITQRNAASRAALGLRRTFQNIRLFGGMTVLENVLVGMHVQTRGWIAGGIIGGWGVARAERAAVETAATVLTTLGLESCANSLAGSLSYGQQRRVEIARALASSPRVLLLDEPAAGLNSAEKREATELICSLPERYGLSVVLVEHDMDLVSDTCSAISVIEYGRPLCDGRPAEVLNDQRVIDAYLGTAVVR
ncbi:ABC transporter ATP-binding protein [Nocardioides daeguensis]|uniref:ABC transporter ATP-binding protein n=1 Tax=Nocardioides daeguensis TaxID=908359 RepID=A0ABP6VJE3_9ACTN|nr:ABC transporter ATP-binding protein [Nocardioides daeguensis]MBV6729019.1 ABC transporter ATP-binding protein [Nocardioides daeguensis]MCR1773540.1 ABC transporter ATP-binding protein [Nocardioides daeguensis]